MSNFRVWQCFPVKERYPSLQCSQKCWWERIPRSSSPIPCCHRHQIWINSENLQEQRTWLSDRLSQSWITNPTAKQGYPVLTYSTRPTLDECTERRKTLRNCDWDILDISCHNLKEKKTQSGRVDFAVLVSFTCSQFQTQFQVSFHPKNKVILDA